MAAVGGFLAGVGAVIAGMSTNSVVLFNLAGVFTLPAFMITQGWLYAAFMVLGGFAASRLLVWILSKIPALKREIPIPGILASKPKSADYFLWVIDYLGDLRIYYFVAAATQYFNQGRTCRRYSTANLVRFRR